MKSSYRYNTIQSQILLQRIFKCYLRFLDLTIAQNEGCYGQIDRSRHF